MVRPSAFVRYWAWVLQNGGLSSKYTSEHLTTDDDVTAARTLPRISRPFFFLDYWMVCLLVLLSRPAMRSAPLEYY